MSFSKTNHVAKEIWNGAEGASILIFRQISTYVFAWKTLRYSRDRASYGVHDNWVSVPLPPYHCPPAPPGVVERPHKFRSGITAVSSNGELLDKLQKTLPKATLAWTFGQSPKMIDWFSYSWTVCFGVPQFSRRGHPTLSEIRQNSFYV